MKIKEPDPDRLCQAMQFSRKALRRSREERREAVRQYVGNHWSEDGTQEKVPINLLNLYISVISRNLIAKNPRAMLSTFDRQIKPAVNAAQEWANRELESMNFGQTMMRVVLDGLFNTGICKVALSTPEEAAFGAWATLAGSAYAMRVDFDDAVWDMHARDFEEVAFIGHRYRSPLEVAREDKNFTKARKDLTASYDPRHNAEGDERVGVLGRGYHAGDSEEFEDLVDLWEVYVPRHKLVYTFADDQVTGGVTTGVKYSGEPLRVQKWIGPETGPYHMLAYGVVPGNILPKAPLQDLIDLHLFVNNLYRKLMRQSERQKHVGFAAGGADADGKRVIDADDGQMIRIDNPDKVSSLSWGGPDQGIFAMFSDARNLFSWLGGNLDIIGGLSPQSKTATQDRMLDANSSRAIADMQERTISYVARVIKSLVWYWWNDPFKVMRVNYSVPGLPHISIQRQVGPEKRRGRFGDLDIRVDPYSMAHSTPQTRLKGLMDIIKGMYFPFAPLAAQQGIFLDLQTLFQKAGAYMDQPDLQDILTYREPIQPETRSDGLGKPAETERTYTRENVPMRTNRGDAQNMANTLMGVDTGMESGAP